MAQEEHDVDKHEQIADENGDDLRLTLSLNLILNRTLWVFTECMNVSECIYVLVSVCIVPPQSK